VAPVVVASAADSRFLPGLIGALRSARAALPQTTDMIAYLLLSGVSGAEATRLRRAIQSWGATTCVIRDPTESLPRQLPVSSRFSIMTYGRLRLPDLIEGDHQRLIYLDADVVVRRDLLDLWETHLRGAPVGASRDYFFGQGSQRDERTDRPLGLAPLGAYFNTGVLLIDLERWRDAAASEHVIDYILRNQERIEYADQDGINAVLGAEIHELDPRWNVQLGSLHDLRHRQSSDFLDGRQETAWQRGLVQGAPAILREGRIWHFVGGKPWTGQGFRLDRMNLRAHADFGRHVARSGYLTRHEAQQIVAASIRGTSQRVRRRMHLRG
jgi:lipopolysaccharide biosynthesis glycosyltransferase